MPSPDAAEAARFDILIADLNGVFRGLSAPLSDAPAVGEDIMWSSSLHAGRFDGAVAEETGYGMAKGDPDFPCRRIAGTDAPTPWRAGGRQALFTMHRPDGAPFELDGWHALNAVLDRFAADGLRPVAATEFEFYLTDDDFAAAGRSGMPDLYSMDEIDRRESLMRAITDAAAAQNVPAGNVISEYGAGQWEINLRHVDAARACLDGLLLRRIVRACAAKSGLRATFMAKPFAGAGGSGMHAHVSVWKGGENLLADDKRMESAVAGALAVCREAFAFFAPFANSYRRFLPGVYAPLSASWARENRAAAVRVPAAKTSAESRLEFRVCGADVNPLLAVAAILAGVHWGMTENLRPPPSQEGDLAQGEPLPQTWRAALDAFGAAKLLPRYFAPAFLRHFAIVKESEWLHHRAYVSDYDKRFYGRVL